MPTLTGTTETEVEISFEVLCASCGHGLYGNTEVGKTARRGMPFIQVEPCPKCLEKAKQEGYESGYQEAYDKYDTT